MQSEAETKELTKRGTISEETLAILDADAEKLEIWVRPCAEGFSYNDQILPAIDGKIVQIQPCWVRWENGKPDRVFEAERPSDAYERRCELRVLTRDNFTVGLSLPGSSYRNLVAYHKFLKGQKLSINEAMTRLRTKEVDGSFGPFVATTFNLIEDEIPF